VTTFVWVLLVVHVSGNVSSGIWTYSTKAECEKDAQNWRKAACVRVEVPR
jgi:hypothetical protein